MTKKFTKYIIFFLLLIIIPILYLNYIGINTLKFNSIIEQKFKEYNPRVDINLKKVNILLVIKDLSIRLKTKDPILIVDQTNHVELEEVSTNISISSYLTGEFSLKNLKLITKKNNIENLLRFYRLINNSPKLIFFNQFLNKGDTKISANLKFDQFGKIKNNYKINGTVYNLNLNLPKLKSIEDLNFNFNISNKIYDFEKINFKYDKILFNSENILIEENKGKFLVKGTINNLKDKINKNFIKFLNKDDSILLDTNKSNFSSKSNFSFEVNKKFKVSKFNLKSNISINEFKVKFKDIYLKNFVEDYNNLLKFKNTKIILKKNDKKLSVSGSSNYFINDEIEEIIDFKIVKNDKKYLFETLINLSSLKLKFENLDYIKKKGAPSSIKLNGIIKDKNILFKEINFINLKNTINIKNLKIERDKIINFEYLNLNYLNKNNFKNQVSINLKNKDYKLKGQSFDAQRFIEKISEENNNKNFFNIFKNLNTKISINVQELRLDNKNKIKNFNGNLDIKNNKIYTLDINSNFSENEKMFIKIVTNTDKSITTNFYSDIAKPFVTKYKFIKGFEDGHIDFFSTDKNNVKNSKLIIDNFKVQEVPILAKILTLASLQGIADLLTGEGIRFTDFEMLYSKKGNLITIDEIYCIGPAISIMMEGYIEKNNLISLRGTLVPATTINRTISSIPLLGDILVGKKVGEGVFGVSFKIKGPPENLKTTVNPIKTLTPRFITRTLEKIKKN
tara:strand:- start:720 stop:2924 length:2205 start_codon:yes stop_codon:yes gene_type:complete